MTTSSFATLVEQTNACSVKIYQHCETAEWDSCVPLIAEREQLLAQLLQLSSELAPAEIEILAGLYQDILKNDEVYLPRAESAKGEINLQLRHIKRAELNALPAYRKHS